MKLDVGCGTNPTGDINVDVKSTQITMVKPQPTVGVNVYCDAQHLPFREKTFDEGYCRALLDHLDNPALALQELERVSKRVMVKVLHRWAYMNNVNPTHKWGFTISWFKAKGYNVRLSYQLIRFLFWAVPWVGILTATKGYQPSLGESLSGSLDERLSPE